MGTRSIAQVPLTNGEIALNAYIFGYGGHSLVTPHAALKQLWWTDERIENKVTRAFVVSKLRGEEREFLDRPLAFGEGLTDDTYMEWILERARRLFLILSAVGVPDQIFGCIDDSWDDDELPVPLDRVKDLELSFKNDDELNRKFYDTQFIYLLRELKQGSHIDYGPKEHIPMEHVPGLPPAVMLQAWDRVHLPKREDKVLMRRKFRLLEKDTGVSHLGTFLKDVKKAQTLEHDHICSAWASYTSENNGFVVSDFVGEHTLGTFIDHRSPSQFLKVSVHERPVVLCEWMHCLADAIASLHHRGTAHTAIRPSNILINKDNQIAFADVGSIRTFQHGKKPKKGEAYDYAAPETSPGKRSPITLPTGPPPSSLSVFHRLRKMSSMSTTTTSSSEDSSVLSSGSSVRRSSFGSTVAGSAATPPSSNGRTYSMTSARTASSPAISSPSTFYSFDQAANPPPPLPTTSWLDTPTMPDPKRLRDLPSASPAMSDVWSLACVYLDILTFMLKGKTTEFLKFRSTLVAEPSQSGGKPKRRTDTSFHADTDKLDGWIAILVADCEKRTERIYRGVPKLLKLVRSMLSQNAHLRPKAIEVRDTIADILIDDSAIDSLCCEGREWPETDIDIAADPNSVRDSMITTTGTLELPPRFDSLAPPRNGPETLCGAESVTSASRPGSSMTVTTSVAASRRGSGGSAATARFMPWKKAFVRSH